jgi:hypothetical protein
MLGGLNKGYYTSSIEGQIHFGMPRGAKMSLAFHSNFELPPSMHHKWKDALISMKNYKRPTSKKVSH